jgi:sec-independent protein translocase protein TatB
LDIGAGELVALAIVAMIVLGPEKLPRYAAEAARVLRRLRDMASEARSEVSRELGPEFKDLSLGDLNPRSMVRKHLLEPVDLDSLDDDPPRPKPADRQGPGAPPATEGEAPRYDSDAT